MVLLNVVRAALILGLVCQSSARKLPTSRYYRNTGDGQARFIGLGGIAGTGNNGNNIAGLGGNNGGNLPNFGNAWQNVLATLMGGWGQLALWDFAGKAQCEVLQEKNLNLVRLENKGVYVFFTEVVTWYQAERACKNLGMHLVTMETKYENDLVIDYIFSQNFYNPDDSLAVWIGLKDGDGDTGTNDYQWITTGMAPTFDYWAYDSNELCGVVYYDNDSLADDVGWDSYSCDSTMPYMCELEGDCAKFINAVDVPYASRN